LRLSGDSGINVCDGYGSYGHEGYLLGVGHGDDFFDGGFSEGLVGNGSRARAKAPLGADAHFIQKHRAAVRQQSAHSA
jgi:hypothetical protein